jgi:hypothetical protein
LYTAVAVPIRFIVVEHLGPAPAPRIGLAGSEAFHETPDPAAIELKAPQEPPQKPDVLSEMFVAPPNGHENPFGPALIPAGPKRHGCVKNKGKNTVMAKMDDFSKFFRKLFGFDPIEELRPIQDYSAARGGMHPPLGAGPKMMAAHAELDEDTKFHILPFMPGPVRAEHPPPPPGPDDVSTHFDTFPPGTSSSRMAPSLTLLMLRTLVH